MKLFESFTSLDSIAQVEVEQETFNLNSTTFLVAFLLIMKNISTSST